jgi:hypothetical protein
VLLFGFPIKRRRGDMRKNKKNKVEIYTSNKKWVVVELIKYIKFDLVLIKLQDGQIIKRKAERIRPVIKRINSECVYVPDSIKKRKKKKKRVRAKKSKFSKPSYILQEYKRDMKNWKNKFYRGQ